MELSEIKKLRLFEISSRDQASMDMTFTGFIALNGDKFLRVLPSIHSSDYLSFKIEDIITVETRDLIDGHQKYEIKVKENATVLKAIRSFGKINKENSHSFVSNSDSSTVRVFSQHLNDFVQVPINPSTIREELLGGMMPVMLVTDNPLSLEYENTKNTWVETTIESL